MKKTNTLLLAQFLAIIYIPMNSSFMKNRNFIDSILGNNLPRNLFLWKKKNKNIIDWIYVTSEFNFYEKKKSEILLTQFWIIIYMNSGSNFYEKQRNFIDLILSNNSYI